MEKSKAKYSILVNTLREKIVSGAYQPGDKLSSENELSEEFGFSRQTVRQALGILEQEGLLVRRRGSGTYVAKTVSAPKTCTIGVVATYITDYIFPVIIRGIEEVLSQHHCRLALGVTKNHVDTERQVLQSMIDSGVDGLIIEGTKTALPNPNIPLYRKLENMGIPCVFFNGYYRELPGSVYVVTNDRESGRRASRLLIEKAGCRCLGGIFKSDDMQGHERYAGFSQGMMECGLELRDDRVVWYSTANRESLFDKENLSYLLRALQGCDGVVCYNDQIAYQLIELLRENRIAVPQQVSVISFDNSRISFYSPVKITSFNHPKEQMGREAAQKILQMLETGHRVPSSVLEMELNEKASVRTIELP